jgi:hypothetical protein
MENLLIYLNWLGEWAFENEMIINPNKCKAICSTKVRAMEPLYYLLRNIVIKEVISCKYLVISLCNNLSWADRVNYRVKKAWKALHFILRTSILKKGNSNTKSLAHTSPVRPILE